MTVYTETFPGPGFDQAWTNTDGWTAVAGQGVPPNSGGTYAFLHLDPAGSLDGVWEFDYPSGNYSSGTGSTFLLFRMASTGNFATVGIQATTVYFQRLSVGSVVEQYDETVPAGGTTIRVELTGNSLVVKLDGVTYMTETISGTLSGNPDMGLVSYGDGSVEVENFSFDDSLTPPPANDQDITDVDAFIFGEDIEDINGDSSRRASSDLFSFTELERVHVVGDFPYYPPFNVAVVPMIYTASFQGNRGYEEPTTTLHLTTGSVYPQINAQLYDPSDQPLDLTAFDYEEIRFHVVCDDGTFITRTCVVDDALLGLVHHDWPNDAPVGSHSARYTLCTLEDVEIEDPEDEDETIIVEVTTGLLSVPTWPLTVKVRESPNG